MGTAFGVGGHLRIPVYRSTVIGLIGLWFPVVVGAEELGRLVQSLEVNAEAKEVGQRVGVVVEAVGNEVEDRRQR